jgi:nicotinamide-nucleotide amidase
MWVETAEPWLRQNGGASSAFVSRRLHFTGIGESDLAEQVGDLFDSVNPTVAPYAALGDVTLRLTASGSSPVQAEALLNPMEEQLLQQTGRFCYGRDDDTLAAVVLRLLGDSGQTLAVAESCTGGALGAALTAVAGSSAVFAGGVIAYSNAVKQQLLGVPEALLDQHGAVSEPVAKAMAEGLRSRLHCDWGIAISGVAGPGGGTVEKPVGMVCLALAGPEGCDAWVQRFGARRGRSAVQQLSVIRALDHLRLRLLSQS